MKNGINTFIDALSETNVLSPCATCKNAREGVLIDDTYFMVKCAIYGIYIPIVQECKDHENQFNGEGESK